MRDASNRSRLNLGWIEGQRQRWRAICEIARAVRRPVRHYGSLREQFVGLSVGRCAVFLAAALCRRRSGPLLLERPAGVNVTGNDKYARKVMGHRSQKDLRVVART